ncbi:MAG: glutamyl-tRNA reductase [Acidobacteriaceae bacterium]
MKTEIQSAETLPRAPASEERRGPTAGETGLVLLGVNHTSAPIEIRERLAIPAGHLAEATRSLMATPGVQEALIVSTCNRVEFLALEEVHAGAEAKLKSFLEDYFSMPLSAVDPHLYELRGREAVRHLFRVASSLDSMVVGEPQILGQVKEAWAVARGVGAIGGNLDPLFQRAFSVAKRVRTETLIGSSSVSIASVAVDLARKIFGGLKGKTVLLVGAGKMSELAARHLIRHGASSILVANRTEARAQKIAESIVRAEVDEGTPAVNAEVLSFDSLYAEAARADIVITSTGAPQQLFGRSHARHFLEQRRNRPMFFIDIAVPRDVDPRMNEVEGCFVYDIDDLQQVAQANQADRHKEAAAAESIVAEEVELYQQQMRSREAGPAIRALQDHAEAIREAELGKTLAKLAGVAPLSEAQHAALEALTRGLTAKLIHPQIVALKRRND